MSEFLMFVVGGPFLLAAVVAVVAIGLFIVATVYAFAKPHIKHLIDAYADWFERRTDL